MTELKVITWNCNGAFRRKFDQLREFDADILVIQECEDPAKSKDFAYQAFASNYLWTGPTKNKGIGVFARHGIPLTKIAFDVGQLELFLPVLIDHQWPLLACWTRHANSPTFGYIGQLWKLLQMDPPFLSTAAAMVIGDLNSNAKWDLWDRWWNHSDVVRKLVSLGLKSAYHQHFSELQGEETQPTLFLQRKLEKPYHVDYGFFGQGWVVQDVEVGGQTPWLELSDHMPVVFKIAQR